MSTELPVLEEFLCVRCARKMKTCCQTSEVFATLGDVDRIQSYSGQSDFVEFRLPDDPIYLQQDDDPVWLEKAFQPDGTRRVLKRQANGDCTFLGNAGCVLPLETRPLICRIYPFDFNAEGLKEQLARGCPTEFLAEGQDLLEALQIERNDAERWHRQLYRELQLENLSVETNRLKQQTLPGMEGQVMENQGIENQGIENNVEVIQ